MKNKWSLVVHNVSQTNANIWVGTLFPDCRKPEKAHVILMDSNNNVVEQVTILKNDWLRPFNKINNRFYQYIRFENLQANVTYKVLFERSEQQINEHTLEKRVLTQGNFATLPAALSDEDPFVIALGSCFYNDGDNGEMSNAYEQLLLRGDKYSKPHVKFFTGDQVYLDIGLDSLSPISSEVRTRIADDYACAWQAQRRVFRQGATWFLADDHEYWNNFPNVDSKNIYLWTITASSRIKKVWHETAALAVKNIQKVKPFRQFSIGNDLNFCFVDLRSQRDAGNSPKAKFLPSNIFKQLIHWAKTLTCTGVIVLPQVLMAPKGKKDDLNLANYTEQYDQLIQALAYSGHDIVCLSGDVHFGRIGKVPLGNNGCTLYEISASPMSNLTGLEALVSVAKPTKQKTFPPHSIIGIPQNPVVYERKWFVSTEKVSLLWLTSYRKTKEHIMTLAFHKSSNNEVCLKIQAWRLREKNRGFPKKEFKQAYSYQLK